jgi:hypothetical protein
MIFLGETTYSDFHKEYIVSLNDIVYRRSYWQHTNVVRWDVVIFENESYSKNKYSITPEEYFNPPKSVHRPYSNRRFVYNSIEDYENLPNYPTKHELEAEFISLTRNVKLNSILDGI